MRRIIVESSDIRIFSDEAYAKAGFEVLDDVSEADVMLGVKEVPARCSNSEQKILLL